MMPSRMRLEVRSQNNLKFDPGASTLGAPPPPRESQRPPRVELSSWLPAAVGDLCCRAPDDRHVYVVMKARKSWLLVVFCLYFYFHISILFGHLV